MIEQTGPEVDTLTIRIPIRLQRRGGRKLIMAPERSAVPTPKPRRDETLMGAPSVRTAGGGGSRAVRPSRSPTSRSRRASRTPTSAGSYRLTCLAPDIVEAILDGRQSKGLRVAEVLGNAPLGWNEQRTNWGFSN